MLMRMRFVRTFAIAVSLISVLSPGFLIAQTQPSSPSTARAISPMPDDDLFAIYRTELGDLFDSNKTGEYRQAHLLIERFFDDPASRNEVVASLKATDLNPAILGRLSRIHIDWPKIEPGVYYVNERLGPHEVVYFFGVPADYDRTRTWPLVVVLPTASPFVNEPNISPQRVQELYTAWIQLEIQRNPDAIVLMPVLHLRDLYGPSYVGMNRVIQPLLHLPTKLNIDTSRIHLIGHSMSAHAAWNLALHYPTYFTSFIAMAGSASQDWQRVRARNLRNTLPIVWHDANDDVIRVEMSRVLVRLLRNLKIDVDYQETKGMGHTPTADLVAALYEKMRTRTRDPYPRQVMMSSNRPDAIFNRVDWIQVYQMLRPGDEKRLNFARVGGFMVVNQFQYTVDAQIVRQNRIDITTDNVEIMRVYLNDQMIDFRRPVTVSVNRRIRFEGMVQPDIELMLKDQLFLGRSWRYYLSAVDLDLSAPASPATARATTILRLTETTTNRGWTRIHADRN